MVISRVTHGSYIWNPGMWSMTLSSQPILPWSTRMASAAVVIALPVEPVGKIVSASTRSGAPSGARRSPWHAPTLPFSTIAIAMPGTPCCWIDGLDARVQSGRRRGEGGGRQRQRGEQGDAHDRC